MRVAGKIADAPDGARPFSLCLAIVLVQPPTASRHVEIGAHKAVGIAIAEPVGRDFREPEMLAELARSHDPGAERFDRLSYREALLYRDWQDALGDAMIERDPDSVRRFRIIGYEKFTQLLATEAPWFKVLSKSIDDIDFDEIDPSDFRSQQLRDLSAAVASILIGVSNTKDATLVDPASLGAATHLRNTITLTQA